MVLRHPRIYIYLTYIEKLIKKILLQYVYHFRSCVFVKKFILLSYEVNLLSNS
jgi:hypothetical protein